MSPRKKIMITGSNGFIGKNLKFALNEKNKYEIKEFSREKSILDLRKMIKESDIIVHLAATNRNKNADRFETDNVDLTKEICNIVAKQKTKIPIIFSSSIQQNNESIYGKSKKICEEIILKLNEEHGVPIFVLRLPNVFGKWAKPNYNSVVATFCYNLHHDLRLDIHDSNALISLIHIDDVVGKITSIINNKITEVNIFPKIEHIYQLTVGELETKLQVMKKGRNLLNVDITSHGLDRALYSTFISYAPKDAFIYQIPSYIDERGKFSELIKTQKSGQISYFTAKPNITRGGHYHHTKVEKFFVLMGEAEFIFEDIISSVVHRMVVSADSDQVVETIPGFAHSVKNIGKSDLVCMVWANEIFDKTRTDTHNWNIIKNA